MIIINGNAPFTELFFMFLFYIFPILLLLSFLFVILGLILEILFKKGKIKESWCIIHWFPLVKEGKKEDEN